MEDSVSGMSLILNIGTLNSQILWVHNLIVKKKIFKAYHMS